MNISQAAKLTGLSIKMIRYYESIGLTPSPIRSNAGYRDYTAQDIKRLHFIYNARQLGFSLAHIKNLLSLWQDENRQSADVKALAQQHVSDLTIKINHLKQIVNELNDLIDACVGNKDSSCSILKQIESLESDKSNECL